MLLRQKCASVTIFRNLKNDIVVSSLIRILETDKNNITDFLSCYSDLTAALYSHNANLSEYILKILLEDENLYITAKAQNKPIDSYIEETAEYELGLFQKLSEITPQELADAFDYNRFIPKWRTSDIDFLSEYRNRINNIGKYGYGLYSKYIMFILKNGKTVPVKHPDAQKLSQLYGYERERKAVIDNTVALLEGKPAQNVLLCGDAGTGKSSTVKAVVNEFADRGLRLIEITKQQLRDIPHIIDSICKNPLKFILFIDDLSFSSDDDCFGALKATLEGSVSARADNIAIYATSNRRHLIKESFSDRDGDDIHRNDTIQQLISLSARFGLTITFTKPDKTAYLDIVKGIAEKYNINTDNEQLAVQAEAFALAGSGRSPRTAKQFVHSLINNQI
ncbi:MAG: ATP-binding protein [Ruminococcus sp.]|nr:ATP-binding protein [Ruminococcus sp.]